MSQDAHLLADFGQDLDVMCDLGTISRNDGVNCRADQMCNPYEQWQQWRNTHDNGLAPSGRRRRTKAERARIAAESMMPGLIVADIARKHGTTRWQICDWRKQIRKGNLVVPESVAALPMFAELAVEDREPVVLASGGNSGIEIVVGDVVIRAGTDSDEGQLTRAIGAARAATS
jgi:transposase